MNSIVEQRCIVAYLDTIQARLASLGEWWLSAVLSLSKDGAGALLARIETQSTGRTIGFSYPTTMEQVN